MLAPAPGAAASRHVFGLFLLGAALWFAAMGQQQVLMPYLVTVRLQESAALVGVAQMTMQLPSLFLALPAGALADRNDPRRQLLFATAIAVVPPLVFAAVVGAGFVTYAGLLVFGVVMGALSAFTMTARDTLLSTVADPARMQNAVSAFMIATFGAQLIGMAIAASAQWIGPAPLFAVQAVLTVASVIALMRIPRLPLRPPATTRGLADLALGLRYAFGAPAIRATLIAMFCIGLFYVGSFIVLVPLLIRDVHQGEASAFALTNVCFWGGSVATNLILMRRRPIERRGRAMLLAMSSGAVILAAMSLDLPFWGFCMLCFAWGMGAGVSLSMGRTIVQESTPPAYRGRTLALFQLGFIGGAPLGALILGFVAGEIGVQRAMLVPGVCAFVLIAAMALFTSLPRVRRG